MLGGNKACGPQLLRPVCIIAEQPSLTATRESSNEDPEWLKIFFKKNTEFLKKINNIYHKLCCDNSCMTYLHLPYRKQKVIFHIQYFNENSNNKSILLNNSNYLEYVSVEQREYSVWKNNPYISCILYVFSYW